MIRTHQEVRMAKDGEEGNELCYGFFKKVSGCQLFKGSSLAPKSWKFCNIFAAL